MLRDFELEIIPMARMFDMALAPWDAHGSGKPQPKKASRSASRRARVYARCFPEVAGLTSKSR